MKIWVVGQFKAETEQGNVWELQGAFSSEERALSACRDEWYFVFPPVEVDEELPHETVCPSGTVYPSYEETD